MAIRPTLQAAWNLRALGLFLLGPVIGVALAAATSGLPPAFLSLAGAMSLFSLCMSGLLVGNEARRLTRYAPRLTQIAEEQPSAGIRIRMHRAAIARSRSHPSDASRCLRPTSSTSTVSP